MRDINLLTLLWMAGDKPIPGDYRRYDKPNDNLSKNNPFTDLLKIDIGTMGRIVPLKADGFITVFWTVSPNRDVEHWATSHLERHPVERLSIAEPTGALENYHRGIKQFCGIEKCQARSTTAQRNRIGFSRRAFLRGEVFS